MIDRLMPQETSFVEVLQLSFLSIASLLKDYTLTWTIYVTFAHIALRKW